MTMPLVPSRNWLTDQDLTEYGNKVRQQYKDFCTYLDGLGLPSFKVARAKYFLQSQQYWVLPDGYSLPPHTINVCVNNLCNLRCRYCDFGQKKDETFYHQYNVVDAGKKIELPLELCKSIVDQARWFRPIIRASFREPMLYKDILPFIEYTKLNGLPFWLLTNGFNLQKYAARLVELGVDSIRLSLDGPAHVHDEIRGMKNAYSRMMDGVKAVLSERDKRNSNMQVGFYFTINDHNYNYIAQTVDALHEEGILEQVFINFQWLLYTTEAMAAKHNQQHGPLCGGYVQESTVLTVDVSKMDIEVMSQQAAHIMRKYPTNRGYRIHFRPSFEEADLKRYRDAEDFLVDDPRCRVLWYNMNINPAGDVKTFHHCLLPEAGNVFQTSLMDIWNGSVLRQQRMDLQTQGAYHGCARCWGIYSLLEDKKRKD